MSTAPELDLASFASAAWEFQSRLADLKREHPLEDHGWYPYDSLTGVATLERLLANDFGPLPALLASEPVLDIGCADGDFSFFLESLGAEVDAIDYAETNFNQLNGARRLREFLSSRVEFYSVNLDWYFELPRARYGLVLFLGALYHLKNPFYVLERLARAGAYCLLSTRIAQSAPDGLEFGEQPVAYLLGEREANDDSTNFWIFSPRGLVRLAERAGWSVVSELRVGATQTSNPVDADADERMFLLLKSRVRYPDLHLRLLDGWHPLEDDALRWTRKSFSLAVQPPARRPVREFALAFRLPERLAAAGPVKLSCAIGGQPAGSASYTEPGEHTFRGRFPESPAASFELSFQVEHGAAPPAGDTRDLGILISFADPSAGGQSGLPFRVS